MPKRTALFEEHQKLGGRIIDFGGWELPVQYSSILDEHRACRSAAGLFDVSHMGEIEVQGADAEDFLNFLVTQNVSKLAVGQAQYTVMCHENGGIVDDLVIYRRSQNLFLVVVNASNTDKDFSHILSVQKRFNEKGRARTSEVKGDGKAPLNERLKISNESARYTQIAIQGQRAQEILAQLTTVDLSAIRTYWFTEGRLLDQIPAIIARTGYTGEDGFELYLAWEKGPEVWRALLQEGAEFGLKPCGLGARDTLRLEMKYPLYGNELTDTTHPLEAGLGWVVKLDKGPFLGKEALIQAKEAGLKRTLVGLRFLGKGIPRHGYEIYTEDGSKKIGVLTSGTQSPSLQIPIAIGYVDVPYNSVGSKVSIDIRGTKSPAEVVPTPFYKRK